MRKRLEKERDAVEASQKAAAEARKAQEAEREEAQKELARVMAELERERQVRFLFSSRCFLFIFYVGCIACGCGRVWVRMCWML